MIEPPPDWFKRITNTLRGAVSTANRETRRLGGCVISDGELLIGLVRTPQSTGSRLLRELGVDRPALVLQLEREPRERDEEGLAPHLLPQTLSFKQTVEAAALLADELGDPRVGTSHVLLALIRNGPEGGSAGRALSERSVTFEVARDTLGKLRKSAGWRDEE